MNPITANTKTSAELQSKAQLRGDLREPAAMDAKKEAVAINTWTAWRPVLRPVARILMAAQLALALQPLSVMAQEKGQLPFNPQAQQQMQRLGALQQDVERAKIANAQANSGPGYRVGQRLARANELVRSLHAETTQSFAAGKSRRGAMSESQKNGQFLALRSALDAIEDDTDAALNEFDATRSELVAKRLPAEILQRHDQAAQAMRDRAQTLRQHARAFKQSPGTQELANLANFFEQFPAARKPAPIEAGKLPWRTPTPATRMPAETKTAWHQNLYGDQKVQLAQAGNVGPIQFTIPPEPGVAPTTADLAETDEVQLTPGIRAKATELGNNPVNIYNWVRNNVDFAPTNGAIQSAQDTLDKKRGNATDTASLLIALLRAANVPARYQWGTVDIPVQQAMNWVGGATKPEAVLQILNQGGIAARGLSSGGQFATVRMEHAWVQAYVNWSPSRGSKNALATQHVNSNGSMNAWVPLDASFKQFSYSAGLDLMMQVPPDTTAFLSAAQQGATVNPAEGSVLNLNQANIQSQLNNYQSRLKTYVDSTATGANSTVGDVIGKKIIPATAPEMLSGGLSYVVVQHTTQATAVPSGLQHRFTYRLFASEQDKANDVPMLSFTEKTSRLVGRRLTISYVPDDRATADLIASYLPRPHADGSPIQPAELPASLPGYLFRLRPQINLDGQVVASASQVLPMGTDIYSSGGFTQLYDANQWDLTGEETNVVGQTTAIGVSSGGVSQAQLTRLQQRLQGARAQLLTNNPANLTGEQIAGDMLTGVIWGWFAAAENHNRLSQNQTSIIENPALSYGLLHLVANPVVSWGVVRRVTFPSVNMDIGHVRNLTWSKDNDSQRWSSYNRLRGQYMSALEGAVPERFFNDPSKCNPTGIASPNVALAPCPRGISTVSAIAVAMSASQKLFTITQEVYANSPNIADALSAHSPSTISRVKQALDAGYEVTIHEAPLSQDGWFGAGFALVDPNTGAGAYLIDGKGNGGSLGGFSDGFLSYFSGLIDGAVHIYKLSSDGSGRANDVMAVLGAAVYAFVIAFLTDADFRDGVYDYTLDHWDFFAGKILAGVLVGLVIGLLLQPMWWISIPIMISLQIFATLGYLLNMINEQLYATLSSRKSAS